MNGVIRRNLEKVKEKELYSLVKDDTSYFYDLASDELTRRALNKLQKTIKIFNEQSSKQTEKMIRLTKWIVCLTIIMIIGLLIQIILAIPTKSYCNGGLNSDGLTYTYTCTTNINLGILGNYFFEREFIRNAPLPSNVF